MTIDYAQHETNRRALGLAMLTSPNWRQHEAATAAAVETPMPAWRRLATWLARLLGIEGRA